MRTRRRRPPPTSLSSQRVPLPRHPLQHLLPPGLPQRAQPRPRPRKPVIGPEIPRRRHPELIRLGHDPPPRMGEPRIRWGRETGEGGGRAEEGRCGAWVGVARGVGGVGVVELLGGVGGVGGGLVGGGGGGLVGDGSAAVAGVVRGHVGVEDGAGTVGVGVVPSLGGEDVLAWRGGAVEVMEALLRIRSWECGRPEAHAIVGVWDVETRVARLLVLWLGGHWSCILELVVAGLRVCVRLEHRGTLRALIVDFGL